MAENSTDVDVEEIVLADPLVRTFGDHPKARILRALFKAAPRSLNPSNIVQMAGLQSRSTWYEYRDELLQTGLIEKTGNAGNSPLYAVREDDELVEKLQYVSSHLGARFREADEGTEKIPSDH